MLFEIHQIKKFLSAYYNLPMDDEGRVLGVPDCEHVIPLGVSETPTRVRVTDDKIYIDPPEAK